MAARDARLTVLELEIMKILWDTGPSPVQEVRDRLIELRDTGRLNQDLEKEIRRREGDQTR